MSTTTSAAAAATASSTEKVLEKKWGKTAIQAGFTALPDVVFRQQKALGLKHLDVLVLLHLASYWWKPNENPWPSKATIADALDVDPRTVQRSVQKMEAMGYVKRIERRSKFGDNMTNQYSLQGLVKHADRLSQEELKLRADRAAEDKKRRVAPKAFALSVVDGGKAK